METNKSIIGRRVLGIADQKILGKVTDVRVDCTERKVAHLIMDGSKAIPLEKIVAVGDSFVTIPSSDIIAKEVQSKHIIDKGFKLVGLPVYSRSGNELGIVMEFEFDEKTCDVENITLKGDACYEKECFGFFVAEFVFINDDETTAIRPSTVKSSSQKERGSSRKSDTKKSENDKLVAFLPGKTVNEDVTSKDGEFSVPAGTVLTAELVLEAQLHDALLLLTMSVDE